MALQEAVGAPLTPQQRGEQARLVARLRAVLGTRFEASSAAGRLQSWERVVTVSGGEVQS